MKLKRAKREKEASPVEVTPKFYYGPDEPTLQLDCWEEELSPTQLDAFKKADEEHKSIQNKLDAIVKDSGGEVVYSGDQYSAYTVSGKAPGLNELSAQNAHLLPSRKEHGSSKKKGRKEKENRYRSPTPPPPPPPEPKKETKKSLRSSKPEKPSKSVPPPTPTKPLKEETKKSLRSSNPEKASKSSSTPTTTNVQSVSSGVRPSEASAIGGLATGTGNKNAIVDLTKDDGKNAPDSREVAFNKLQGKTFPSLVVVARPYLRAKEGPGNSDRPALDSKVKSVLMHTPTKFTEWLIQQGLVRSEQLCAIHVGDKLKLGMYSDVSKFPYSGGYVWISECCPTRFVSVFSGSLFEGAIHPPSVLLKLIYHWACQTNVQNVVQWVKVDNLYVKGLFTWLRAVCTAALHHHMSLMGGSGKRIEVGVISLGTTSHDGLQRQVKVEVLGILDTEAKLVRLRAVEPLADGERNYKKRFLKILEPLSQWVHTDSIILTDLTVDKGTLIQMGYKTVHQVSANEPASKNSNSNIMEYLRRIVPRMFQNTLSLLSRQIIQQFLDELVWREWYGTSPGLAFDNIVAHIAEQTRLDTKDTLLVRLNKISSNPFKNWKYASLKPAKTAPPPVVEVPKETLLGRGRRKRKPVSRSPSPPPLPDPPSPPSRRSASGKETRKRKRINYHEDDDDEVIMMETPKKDKKPKRSPYVNKKEEKKKEEKKKEEKVKEKKKDDKKEKKKEEIKISIKKEPRDENVDLEGYYFGQLEGQFKELFKRRMLVQCTECSEEFNCNASLQVHLFGHSNNQEGSQIPEGTEDSQCKYCIQHCGTPEALEGHLLQAHPVDTKSQGLHTLACLICEVRFATVLALSNHLQKSHVHLELPYNCGVCGYRTSSHRTCVDHFYTEHNDSAGLQCPFCLKVIKVFAEGCDLQANVEFFLQHIRKHQNKQNIVKCNRCALNFVHLGALKEHQMGSHGTVFGARPLCSQGHLIAKPKKKATPPVKDSANHTFLEVYDDMVLDIPEGMLCKECDSLLEDERHFLGFCKCSKCPYQTGCWRALLQHAGICRDNKTRGQQAAPLTNVMHCICSFSTQNGNALAAHLVQCERQSAYPSEEQAKVNTVTLAATKHGMMDSLGLQRNKEPEESPVPQSQQTQPQTQPQPPAQSQSENITDYPAPPSVLNTQLSLDDLAPPSVLQQDQMVEIEQLKNEAYEQPLATPRVQHDDMDVGSEFIPPSTNVAGQGLDSYMDSTGEFEPLPAEPMPQPEFEPNKLVDIIIYAFFLISLQILFQTYFQHRDQPVIFDHCP